MSDISVSGAKILFELPFGLTISETQVNMWIVMAAIAAICIWLTHGMKVKPDSKRQIVAQFWLKRLLISWNRIWERGSLDLHHM